MKEILLKLTELVEEIQVAKKVYNEKTTKAEATIESQAKMEHQLKEETLLLREREANIEALEITAATKVKLAEDVARVSSESNALEDSKRVFIAYKAEEENKLDALRADGDMQQESLNKQKIQLDADRKTYKDEVLKEVAKAANLKG